MNKCSASIADDSPALVQHLMFAGLPDMTGNSPGKMSNGNMNSRSMYAEIATCAIAGDLLRGLSVMWKGHIVIVFDRFLVERCSTFSVNVGLSGFLYD